MHLDGFDDGGELPGPDAIRKSLRMGRPCKMTNRILNKVSPFRNASDLQDIIQTDQGCDLMLGGCAWRLCSTRSSRRKKTNQRDCEWEDEQAFSKHLSSR